MKNFEVDESEALERYLALTAIRGRSGEEKDVADEIVHRLVDAGLDPDHLQFDGAERRTRIAGNCGNLIVHLPGSGDGPRTLLSAHMDTVPICLGSEPYVDGDQVRSRGATGLGADDRSGCAAILTAAIARLRHGGDSLPPAVLAFFIQEEVGLEGARHLDVSRIGKVDRAFNFDGGPVEKVTIGAIGGERMEITLTGIPAHAGVAPENGASAIVMAARAIADLDARGWLGRVEKEQGVGTANVGVIQGGEATNVITPAVVMRAEARSHDPAMRTKIVSELRSAFESAAASVQNAEGLGGECQFRSHVDYEAFRLPEGDPSVDALEDAIRGLGREPYQKLAGGGLDANWLAQHGINAVTVGCGQQNIHTADERLQIPDYFDACRIATHLIGSHGPS
ncbi:M20/M25/M40 family metallo-hydrolase [Roseiconus nitratireducens]|uniref:M20/M25/M40 family metallo-hydrolase n=1 Tax=Roseiconus nitratireducens TaxID=2605748 RepID=A0A5M6DF86_9BACT|nr:M20/M25/M40 family metallo-hydrolase [Roseiconus nitratireducens]KAA5546148.1 M20/M25/M40 family metallo-hydrolase [Roseiconus nitratireducens]